MWFRNNWFSKQLVFETNSTEANLQSITRKLELIICYYDKGLKILNVQFHTQELDECNNVKNNIIILYLVGLFQITSFLVLNFFSVKTSHYFLALFVGNFLA